MNPKKSYSILFRIVVFSLLTGSGIIGTQGVLNSNGGFNAEISGTDNDNNRNRSAASNDAPVMSRLEAGTDAKPWLFQVDLKSGEGIIELTDGPDPPCIFFLHFGNHCFEPAHLFWKVRNMTIGK